MEPSDKSRNQSTSGNATDSGDAASDKASSAKASPEDAAALPASGRLLGIDYGTKRVGVAVSDQFQEFSSPLHNYDRSSSLADGQFFQDVVAENQIVGLVVGLPIHMNGEESQKSLEAREYARWLTNLTGLPHDFQDERLTSVQAESMLLQAQLSKKKRKSRMDKLAAQILLQSFLDSRRPPKKSSGETADVPAVDEFQFPLNDPPQRSLRPGRRRKNRRP